MPIQLLTPETVGKIAAGEVVERPSSVVKELIENAIDAGASRIAVEIADGGSALIRVSDDGYGMSIDELSLAILRHATSKLAVFDDLDRLGTLGFRGEALPSIGAVSRLVIRSSTQRSGSGAGATIDIDYGAASAARIQAAPGGTTVTVSDLFGNVPARRKFLRQASTEASYVSRLIGAYACNRSAVQWSLVNDGRKVLATPGNGLDADAAIGVFGPELVDEVLLLDSGTVESAVPGVRVTGWVSSPRVTRSHRQNLFFFVNGRLVQHRALTYALEEAFHSLLMVGRHPLGMVRIELDPAAVDVNVHPAKSEVKFIDERAVCRAVQRSAHATLVQQHHDVLPQVSFVAPEPRGASIEQSDLGAWTARQPSQPRSSDAAEDEPAHRPHPSGVPVMRVLGQVGSTYIVAEGPQGMFMIDQHAAHERVMYEKILGQMQAHAVERQVMLDPLVVELAPDELAAFERSQDELREIGFEIERFGEQSVAIREVPAVIRGVDITERIHLILGELAEGGAGSSWLDSVAISAACHTSIRAGQALSLAEMRELVAQLERTSQPRACGHGRPTMLHMSQTELERQFSRR